MTGVYGFSADPSLWLSGCVAACTAVCTRSWGLGLGSSSVSWRGFRKREEEEEDEEELGTRQERGNICLLSRDEVEGCLVCSSFSFSAWAKQGKKKRWSYIELEQTCRADRC